MTQKPGARAALEPLFRPTLDALRDNHPEIAAALVSSPDGFEVATSCRMPLAAATLSAMASSLVALAEAMSAEAARGRCRDVVIDAEQGRVLLMDVPGEDGGLLLTVLCDASATLGTMLWAVRAARETLAGQLAAAA